MDCNQHGTSLGSPLQTHPEFCVPRDSESCQVDKDDEHQLIKPSLCPLAHGTSPFYPTLLVKVLNVKRLAKNACGHTNDPQNAFCACHLSVEELMGECGSPRLAARPRRAEGSTQLRHYGLPFLVCGSPEVPERCCHGSDYLLLITVLPGPAGYGGFRSSVLNY